MRAKTVIGRIGISGSRKSGGTIQLIDQVTDYPSKIERRSNIIKGNHRNPLPYSAYFCHGKPGSYSRQGGGWDLSGLWHRPPDSLPYVGNWQTGLPTFNTNHQAFWQAENAMYSKLAKGKLELGLELAQVRQTASMLAGVIVDLSNLIHNIKSGNLNAAFRQLFRSYSGSHGTVANNKKFKKWTRRLARKKFSDRWLELQFGVKPLLSTIKDTIDRISDHTKWDSLYVYAKGSSRLKFASRSVSAPSNTTQKVSGNLFVTVRQCARVTTPFIRGLSSFGMAPGDLAVVLWDLVPFSFVVDWFIPINKWIKSFAIQQGLEPVTSRSYWTQCLKVISHTTYKYDFAYVNAECTNIVTAMERRLYSGWPMPSLQYRPDWLNAWTVATSAALLNQRLKG